MVASTNIATGESLFLDSSASHYLTQNAVGLNNITNYTRADQVTIGNGKRLSILSFGSKDLVTNSHSFKLRKVFHVPFISANLISVAKLCSDNNALIEFYSHSFFVKDQLTKKVLA